MNLNLSKRLLLHLLPRILAIFFIFFISIFAFDVFDMEGSLLRKIAAFLIHLIPTYILIAVYLIAKKWEIPGGVAYIFLGLLYIFTFRRQDVIAYIILSGSLFLIGILFILDGYLKKKTNT
jgi:hypothetical protein